jgi:hypothetical protein
MTEASVSFAGNLTDDPELRHTEGGIARSMFRVAVSGRREQEASFFTVVVWRERRSGDPGRLTSPTSQAPHEPSSRPQGARGLLLARPRWWLPGYLA